MKRGARTGGFSLLCFVLPLFFVPSSISAAERAVLTKIKSSTTGEETTFYFDLSAPVTVTHVHAANPERLFIIFREATLSKDVTAEAPAEGGSLEGIQVEQTGDDAVRILIRLPDRESTYRITTGERPFQVVLHIFTGPAPASSTGAGKQEAAITGTSGRGEVKVSHPDVPVDFREYVVMVLNRNPLSKISEEDYKKSLISFAKGLQAYDFSVFLNSSASAAMGDDDRVETGWSLWLNAVKNLYDGGKRQILEKEYEVVKSLARANVLENRDALILASANYYADVLYRQQAAAYLKHQYEQHRSLVSIIEKQYQAGTLFSPYDLYTSRSDTLRLERAVVQNRSDLIKAEVAFRQFGHIYADKTIRLGPLDIDFRPEVEHLQKYAVVHNSAIHAERLRNEVQTYRIAEREADLGPLVSTGAAAGFKAGAGGYAPGNNLIAGIYLNFSLPLYDGGVRRSAILEEKVEMAKRIYTLDKTTEGVIRSLTEIYTDYKTIERDLEIVEELKQVDEKRLNVSLERLWKGVGQYRDVRDSWDELIRTDTELIRLHILSQKLLIDLSVLSGKNVLD